MARINKLIGSGGVIIAERITAIIMASLRYFRRKSGVKRPIDENKKEITGNSKTKPEPRISASTKLK